MLEGHQVASMSGLACLVCRRSDYPETDLRSHLWTRHRKADLVASLLEHSLSNPSASGSTGLDPEPPDGCLVYVRYRDHVLFRDVDPSLHGPWTRETVGWLDYEDPDYLRIIWERFAVPDPPAESKPRATGLVILKKAVLEMRRLG